MDARNPTDLSFLEVSALLDTGATGGAISPRIINHFGLEPFEKRYLKVATEDRLANYYYYRIGLFPDISADHSLSSGLPFVFGEIVGFGMQSSSNFDMIIGMNLLKQCDFSMNRSGAWTLAFG